MDKEIILSIIVPIYNVAGYLPQCIDSILCQDFTDFELILVNDGSTDSSFSICEQYAKKDSRVKVINKSNGGLISAKKAGLQQAIGKYVGFVDGDDWIDKDMYARMCEAALVADADIVISDNIVEFPTSTLIVKQGIDYGIYEKDKLIQLVYPNLAFAGELYKLGVSPSLCTKIFRRILVTPFQFAVNECIKGGEDAACTYPCMLKAEKIVYVEGCCGYHYRVHNQSMTHKKREIDMEERMILLTHLGEAFQKYNYSGLDEQIGFYAAAVLEELVLNFFEYRRNRELKKVNNLIMQAQENYVWKYVTRMYENAMYPKATNCILEYLMKPSRVNECKVTMRVNFNSFKRFLKGVILKINGRKN